jgi:hypothetical protein
MQARMNDHLDPRLDRLISRGREVVNGVAGARPGGRTAAAAGGREGERRTGWRNELDGLGRWVENRLDRLLDDEADWREPWQEDDPTQRRRRTEANAFQSPQPPATLTGVRPGPIRSVSGGSNPGRRPLEAISRRGQGQILTGSKDLRRQVAEQPPTRVEPAAGQAPDLNDPAQEPWPDDALFSVPRWSRPIRAAVGDVAEPPAMLRSEDRLAGPEAQSPSRPLPRSSRQRSR